MDRRRPPETAAGYYVLHDFRRIDWDAWKACDEAVQESMLAEAAEFFDDLTTGEGDVGLYSVQGHKADLLVLILRPTMSAIDTIERQFNRLDIAGVTERTTSAVGVTEASGYTEAAADFFDPDAEADPGIERYLQTRLYPSLPDAEFVSFYFMNKRRHPDENWYDLPYDERAEHVASHGEIGKGYAGRVTQLITGTMGFDDWEWGVTLFSNDMVAIKDLLGEMRFDPSTSRYAEFGQFYVGRRFPPADLPAFFAGEELPTEADTAAGDQAILDRLEALDVDAPADGAAVILSSDADAEAIEAELDGLRANFEHYDSHIETTVTTENGESVVVSLWTTNRAAETASGFLEELPGVTDQLVGRVPASEQTDAPSTADETARDVREELERAGVYAGQPHGEDLHALVVYSTADVEPLSDTVTDLASNFDRYDTHHGTTVYDAVVGARTAVVSLWETSDAAETAAGYLKDLPGVSEPDEPGAFGTMGMFYTVVPDHREDFVDTFEAVGEVLAGMDGHHQTDLLANVDDPNEMFIASRWAAKEDAMEFFRSDEFRDTVQWGREVLADRPRHVFLA